VSKRSTSITKELFLSWWGSYRDSFFFVFLPMFFGMVFVLWQEDINRPKAGLWAFACLAAGSLVGFIFGVPRAVQEGNTPPEQLRKSTVHNFPVIRTNTNLERVSDWLTKAIIGVGLVELKKIPILVGDVASYVVGAQSPQGAKSTAAALIVLFSTLGFIGGYVNTRLFFAVAFSRADTLSRQGAEEEGDHMVDGKVPNTAAQPDGYAAG
jgi:hypothetical protein